MGILDLLRQAVEHKASDLHITTGIPPCMRIYGKLTSVPGAPALSQQDAEALICELMDDEVRAKFLQDGEVDFSYGVSGLARFRVNAFRQRGSACASIRVVPFEVMPLDELGVPPVVKELLNRPRGLILVGGPTGCGKSTTLASMVDYINSNRRCHLITIEEPIEYLHRHKMSIVNQREIGIDSRSFSSALAAALRGDPDVIMVGELPDTDTIELAISAAEMGALVLASFRAPSIIYGLERLIEVFPVERREQVRVQLATNILAAISQNLVPRKDGQGWALACEIMVTTPAIRGLLREGKLHQIRSTMETGGRFGMQTMDRALYDLVFSGAISPDDALLYAHDPDELRGRLRERRPGTWPGGAEIPS